MNQYWISLLEPFKKGTLSTVSGWEGVWVGDLLGWPATDRLTPIRLHHGKRSPMNQRTIALKVVCFFSLGMVAEGLWWRMGLGMAVGCGKGVESAAGHPQLVLHSLETVARL